MDIRLALPKGRMHAGVLALLAQAGISVRASTRGYRPVVSLDAVETKVLKPQSVVEMVHAGTRDVGFAGADWVAELDANVVDLLDTRLDPVRVVAAAPSELLVDGALPDAPLVVASEYPRLTRSWIEDRDLDATFVRSYGATEVFPPEDADCIVDNTATGSTLRANGLHIVDELMRSSTRLVASRSAMDTPRIRDRIEALALLLAAVVEARDRVMLEVNVTDGSLERVLDVVPGMKEPTVSPLSRGSGFAVKAAVFRNELPQVVPLLRACGGTDILVTELAGVLP